MSLSTKRIPTYNEFTILIEYDDGRKEVNLLSRAPDVTSAMNHFAYRFDIVDKVVKSREAIWCCLAPARKYEAIREDSELEVRKQLVRARFFKAFTALEDHIAPLSGGRACALSTAFSKRKVGK